MNALEQFNPTLFVEDSTLPVIVILPIRARRSNGDEWLTTVHTAGVLLHEAPRFDDCRGFVLPQPRIATRGIIFTVLKLDTAVFI